MWESPLMFQFLVSDKIYLFTLTNSRPWWPGKGDSTQWEVYAVFDLSSDDYDNDQIEKMVLSASLCYHVSPLIPASDDFDTTFALMNVQ